MVKAWARLKGKTGLHEPQHCYWEGKRFAVISLTDDSDLSLIHLPTGCVTAWEGRVGNLDRMIQVGEALDECSLWAILDNASPGYNLEYLPKDIQSRLNQSVNSAIARTHEKVD